jgi:hypothetical protein
VKRSLILLLACCARGDKQEQPGSSAAVGEGSGAVDVCRLVPRERVDAAIGETEGAAHNVAERPPVIGSCTYRIGEDVRVKVTARSLTDFDAMANGGRELTGLGEQAYMTQGGIAMKLTGKPYMVHAVVTGPNGLDEEKTVELGKIVASAK